MRVIIVRPPLVVMLFRKYTAFLLPVAMSAVQRIIMQKKSKLATDLSVPQKYGVQFALHLIHK
jgi:hypothetical protein